MNKNNVLIFLIVIASLCQYSSAQNNTNSLYTRFGFGEISDAHTAEQRAMGGSALGLRSRMSINTINPASYSCVDSMIFMFDVGGSALLTKISNSSMQKQAFNGNLDYITMQFPLSRNIGFSAGLLPYSFVGYNFYTVVRTPEYDSKYTTSTQSFSGEGGFNQVYMGLATKIKEHFSLGANIYYMFGSVSHYRNMTLDSVSSEAASSVGATPSTQMNIITAKNFRFRLGAQYFNTFADRHDITVGAIFEKKMNLHGTFTDRMASQVSDTIEAPSESSYGLPATYGLGLNYCLDKKFSVALDYTTQRWADVKYAGKTDSLSNRSKVSVGLQFIPNPYGRKQSDHIQYRAGFSMSDAYFKSVGTTNPNKNYSFSVGFGIPVFDMISKSTSMLNLSFEYGKIGGVSALKESYYKFTVNMAFKEHWFFRRKL